MISFQYMQNSMLGVAIQMKNRLFKREKGIYLKNKEWLLNIYLFKSDIYEKVCNEEIQSLITDKLYELEEECMSEEFCYLKIGFAFLHFGNRGINLSIWHIGKWGVTYEIFECSWYCYKREKDKMERLDSAEPALSMFEVSAVTQELKVIEEIMEICQSEKDIKDLYIKKWNISRGK